SAALDNLTTTIVMISLLRKLVADKKERWFFAGLVVIAANAGGAWSPIGDVTTTMLWIGTQISAFNVITELFVPSAICILVPLIWLSFTQKGEIARPVISQEAEHVRNRTTPFERNLIFFLGLALLLFVPVFKTVTHLPPYMGMMFGLGVLWVVTEVIHRQKNHEVKSELSVIGVLRKIDIVSVLFFLGILIASSSLQSAGHLTAMAKILDENIGDIYAVNIIIGLLSAIVDNVPLVAASMGMYPIASPEMLEAMNATDSAYYIHFVQDGNFWEFLAYCAGTGGSALIIGSAAGVAVMGMERIDFIWYMKKMSLFAISGYLAGAAYYVLVVA
ncbi:MAG: Na+/H+ antiporter NhaD/arsenite permease-like protein, partial [Vicingaceae bacterium]